MKHFKKIVLEKFHRKILQESYHLLYTKYLHLFIKIFRQSLLKRIKQIALFNRWQLH